MTNLEYILVFTAAVAVAATPFFSLRMLKGILVLLFWPYYIYKWYRGKKSAHQRQRNYEILGNYVALLGNNPTTLSYFRNLIETGVSEKRLVELLEINLNKLMTYQENAEIKKIEKQKENKEEIEQLLQEQKELLIQSRLSLEQIKFREKLLNGLYQKIQKKYRM